MDPGSGNNIVNVDGDRLSSLSDDLIHKILSFISIKDAVKTSVLSSRWRYTWTSTRHLNFSTEDFSISSRFSQFVEHVLSHRNHLVHVFSVKLSFGGCPTQAFVERILNYASTHNVQHLSVTCMSNKNFVFPLSLFSSQLLKHLTLTRSRDNMSPRDTMFFIKLKSSWELPALTTLHLSNSDLYEVSSEIFSNCPNLKNLTLKTCMKTGRFSISHSQLLNLTLENICARVYVEAPQLKTLTVSISRGYCSLKFSGDNLSLEKVDMCITNARESHAHEIVDLFQQFRNVKFLTLNLEIVELISSSVRVVSRRSSSFANLESLEIYPVKNLVNRPAKTNVNVYSFVKTYFFDNSASATLAMVLHEEITARELMQRMLNEWEANTHKEMNVKYRMLQQETRWQLQYGERIESFWKDFYKWVKEGDTETHRVISMLRVIEQLLQKLPRLQRDKMQLMYSSLCAEADSSHCDFSNLKV